ncbi:MAG: transcription antitermination factor NusB [Candidatus Sumerlaeota bacterium]|nr:transcription antitermination factor NusB [Candidatus Sumerlaeota bacterium]
MRRRLNRQLAVQALYAFAIEGAPVQKILDKMSVVLAPDEDHSVGRKTKEEFKTLKPADSFVRELCQRTCDHLQYIDDKLAHAVEHWKPERLQMVDRAILRLATCEILYYADIPPRVTLDEYIEIAKKFCEDQSPAFINGVLDQLMAKNPKMQSPIEAGGQP